MQNNEGSSKRLNVLGAGLGLVGSILVFIPAASGQFSLLVWLFQIVYGKPGDAFWIIAEFIFLGATVPFWLVGALVLGWIGGGRYARARRTIGADSATILRKVWVFGLMAGSAFALLSVVWSLWLIENAVIFLVEIAVTALIVIGLTALITRLLFSVLRSESPASKSLAPTEPDELREPEKDTGDSAPDDFRLRSMWRGALWGIPAGVLTLVLSVPLANVSAIALGEISAGLIFGRIRQIQDLWTTDFTLGVFDRMFRGTAGSVFWGVVSGLIVGAVLGYHLGSRRLGGQSESDARTFRNLASLEGALLGGFVCGGLFATFGTMGSQLQIDGWIYPAGVIIGGGSFLVVGNVLAKWIWRERGGQEQGTALFGWRWLAPFVVVTALGWLVTVGLSLGSGLSTALTKYPMEGLRESPISAIVPAPRPLPSPVSGPTSDPSFTPVPVADTTGWQERFSDSFLPTQPTGWGAVSDPNPNQTSKRNNVDGKFRWEYETTTPEASTTTRAYPPVRSMPANFQVTATGQRVEGPVECGYGVELDSYAFVVRDTQEWFLVGNMFNSPNPPRLLQGNSTAIRNDAPNTLKVIAQASNFVFFVNGKRIGQFENAPLNDPSVGLMMQNGRVGKCVIDFDDFELRIP